MKSMWWASDRDYDDEIHRYDSPPPPRTEPVLVCRCGSRMDEGTCIGHLSMQTVCKQCAQAEGAEYLRRRAAASHQGAA